MQRQWQRELATTFGVGEEEEARIPLRSRWHAVPMTAPLNRVDAGCGAETLFWSMSWSAREKIGHFFPRRHGRCL